MTRYRKKPVVIEAERFSADGPGNGNGQALADWCGGRYWRDGQPFGRRNHPVIEIDTLEGVMTANPGDWIIKGVKGEFYPVKPDVFEATYEPAEVTR